MKTHARVVVIGDAAEQLRRPGPLMPRFPDCRTGELLEDTQACRVAKAEGGEMIPHEVVKRLVAGVSPVRVYREYRGLTQRVLAERAKLATSYLSQIETGQRTGSAKLLRRIADALDLTIDDLI